MTTLRLGTRASRLARTQSGIVAQALTDTAAVTVELVDVKTFGDLHKGSLSQMPQPGVFVSALRDALAANTVDCAVHSFKDLPSQPLDDIVVAATPPRESPFDALITRNGLQLASLPAGARVGTGSPRRAARLKASRPDVTVVDLRGNVDTRLDTVFSGQLDAVVLAVAGLERIGRAEVISEILAPEVMLPAPAQGALAVECRRADQTVHTALATIDDFSTRVCVTAERAVLAAVDASCASAIGALATHTNGTVTLLCDASGTRGEHVMLTGSVPIVPDTALADAHALGLALGKQLLDAGADRFLQR